MGQVCRFSPVAGIQWVETLGYSNGREPTDCFSPVAGIQWVETLLPLYFSLYSPGFSPVAGIQWVETFSTASIIILCCVSVPLPGFSGLRLGYQKRSVIGLIKFQSRCRDSVG